MGRKWSICAAEILNRACRRWVKSGKARSEHFSSAIHSKADMNSVALKFDPDAPA
jgi:hypothetical protein